MIRTALALAILFSSAAADRGATGVPPEPVRVVEDATHLVTLFPTWETEGEAGAEPGRSLEIPPYYDPVDSLTLDCLVPAGGELVVKMDYSTGELSVTEAPYTLTQDAQDAVDAAPDWMADRLQWRLSQLTESNQDRYADLINGITQPEILDEVAYQVATLSWTILANPNWDETVIVNGAELMYELDADLQFVEIMDYNTGTPEAYSTTRYTVVLEGDTTTVEIPKEEYYDWVVMPKVSDEVPLQNDFVYDMFWREYLYYENDPGYPNLKEVLEPLTVVWDGQEYNWSGGRPFTDSMMVVDAIGNWCSETVPDPASGNRPIQPNVIAHEHNGNCGELQDLLCAAGRTCLLPMACTMDVLEDHVWCEIRWQGDWKPYQVELGGNRTQIGNYGIAYDEDMGGSKECSCIWDWRNDGWTWDVIGRYSDTCTLTVHVEDSVGTPVDNVQVTIASEYWQQSAVGRGSWAWTDREGNAEFVLGDNQSFYINLYCDLGIYPGGGFADLIENSEAGEHYYFQWIPSDTMPSVEATEVPMGTDRKYLIQVDYQVPCDVSTGRDYYANPRSEFLEPLDEGGTTFFFTDQDGLEAYMDDQPFEACEVAEYSSSGYTEFVIPHDRSYYTVFSGRNYQGLSSWVEADITLWEHDGTAVEGGRMDYVLGLSATPNPMAASGRLDLVVPSAGRCTLRIYDLTGRLVAQPLAGELARGPHSVTLDAEELGLAGGVYLARLSTPAGSKVSKLVVVR
ncbi:MAG: T9SS type A sorting domain-containing protein [Candidatus Fermentibacterota bacterium]